MNFTGWKKSGIILLEATLINLGQGRRDMYLMQKLKSLEKQIVFLRWGSCGEYGKIKYVGRDFIEFQIIDEETSEYSETVIINPSLLLEMVLGSSDINRVIAAVSCKLPSPGQEK